MIKYSLCRISCLSDNIRKTAFSELRWKCPKICESGCCVTKVFEFGSCPRKKSENAKFGVIFWRFKLATSLLNVLAVEHRLFFFQWHLCWPDVAWSCDTMIATRALATTLVFLTGIRMLDLMVEHSENTVRLKLNFAMWISFYHLHMTDFLLHIYILI